MIMPGECKLLAREITIRAKKVTFKKHDLIRGRQLYYMQGTNMITMISNDRKKKYFKKKVIPKVLTHLQPECVHLGTARTAIPSCPAARWAHTIAAVPPPTPPPDCRWHARRRRRHTRGRSRCPERDSPDLGNSEVGMGKWWEHMGRHGNAPVGYPLVN